MNRRIRTLHKFCIQQTPIITMIKRESDIERIKRVKVRRIKSEFVHKMRLTYDSLTKSQIEYLAGMGAAGCSTMITYPINKIIFRQSLWGFEYDKAFRQLRIEGLTKLFRGCLPPVVTKSLNASVMFGTYNDYYTYIREGYIGKLLRENVIAEKFCAGIASGTTEAVLMPLERIQMLLQDGRLNNRYRNTIHVIVALRKHGISEYYRGVTAVLLRNGPSTFLYFGLKDPLKDIIAGYHQNLAKPRSILETKELLSHFVSGALLGAVISTTAFPLNVIRIHMQTQEIGSEHHTIWRTFKRLYAEADGRKKLVSGIHMNAFRSVLYWGCITVFSESLRQYFHHD